MSFKTLKECISQLEKCGYEDNQGHPLERNIAFIQIKQLSEKEAILMPVEKTCKSCIEREYCKYYK